MKKNKLTNFLNWNLWLMLLAAMFVVACDDDDDPVVEEPTGTIVVTDQLFDENDGMVIIDNVTLSDDGWVVIHQDNNGAPGAVVGVSDLVEAGQNQTDVVVEFNDNFTPSPGETFWAMLHRDSGQAGVFEFTGSGSPDQPIVGSNGNPVMVMFDYNFPVGAEVTAIEMMEMNDSGVTGTAYLYDGMNDLAWVILEMDNTTAGVMHPAHIHSDTDGSIVYPLTSVNGDTGLSFTSFDNVTYDDLVGYDGYINVHLSPDDLSVVSQGNTDDD